MKFLPKIEQLLIGLWLGAAVFFMFAVAPSVFSVLESREMAGYVVNRTLTIVNFSGLIIGIILLVLSFIPRGESKMLWAWLQRILLFIVALTCGAGQAIIGIYMRYLRSMSEKPMSELPADNPIKMQFDMWHQYSVWILVAGMIAALLAFFIISRSYSGGASAKTKSGGSDVPPIDLNLPPELKL